MNDPQNPYQPPAVNPGPNSVIPKKGPLPSAASEVPLAQQVEEDSGVRVPCSPPTNPNRHTGKVGRLPKVIRDQISQMIDDGHTYAEVIQELGEAGQKLSERNICNWKSGGYQAWVREQQRLQAMRFRQEFALDLVQDNDGAATQQAAFHIAALQLCDLLDDFDPALMKNALGSDPATYAMLLNAYTRLLNAMPRLSGAEADCERRREEAADHKTRKEKGKGGEKPPGLSEESRRLIEKDLNLM